MALEHYFSQERKSIPNAVTDTEISGGCFDCNICLDFAHEPVVTLCGHLYCWPCIYKWLHVQSDSLAPDEPPQCPVCKADISHTTMVPLYGRGQIQPDGKASSCCGGFVPPRPPASSVQALLASSSSSQSGQRTPYRNPYQGQYLGPPLNQEGDDAASQMLNNLGEMVYARVFGNSENLHAYPNSYQMMGSNSPRLRRQEMEANKSLNRISIFLFCCFLLCLIVF